MVRSNALAAGEHQRCLQGLLQLAHIARPTVEEERPGCLAGEGDLIHGARVLAAHKRADEQPQVFTALA